MAAVNKPECIIIHHSLTKDNEVLSSFDAIRNNHINVRKFRDIGYHWLLEYVNRKLVWREGRKEKEVGAHTKELGMNAKSISICVVGNFDEMPPTAAIYKAVAEKIKEINARWGKDMAIFGHGRFATYKSCPGKLFDLNKVANLVYPSPIEGYKKTIQEHCGFSAPEQVFKLLDTHQFAEALYRKWAESYQ